MRIYISADLEGVAGIVAREQLSPEGFDYEASRHSMTEEVNAAIRGAKSAGATQFVVSDSHGNGRTIIPDRLEKGATLVRSWPRPLAMMQGIESGRFEGALFVGYHAGADSPGGCLSHTMSSRAISSISVNDQTISEGLISAAISGFFATPVLFASGDDVFVNEIQNYLGPLPAVVTKWSMGTLSARSKLPSEVIAELEESVSMAVRSRADRTVYRLDGPLNCEITMKSRVSAELLSYLPFIDRMGAQRVGFVAKDVIEFSKCLEFILHYAPAL